MTSKVTTETKQEGRSVSEEFSVPSYVLKQQRRHEKRVKEILCTCSSGTKSGHYCFGEDPDTECETLKDHLASCYFKSVLNRTATMHML